MLTSLGVDIVEIDRIRQALQRHPKLASRLFTEKERAYCDLHKDPAPHYAARFAAKEATAKALGRWLRWQDVEVAREPTGRPAITVKDEAAELAHVAEGAQLLVSMSHSRDFAIACVALVFPSETEGAAGQIIPPGVWT